MLNGRRGFPPKPTAVVKREGNPGHRTLPKNEIDYPAGLPLKPPRISTSAGRVWDELSGLMGSRVLRRVDRRALWQLCEDEALLAEVYQGIWKMSRALKKKADEEKRVLPAGPLVALLGMSGGRLAMAAIRDLATRTIVERREFGLTPSSRSRIEVTGEDAAADLLELKLCG